MTSEREVFPALCAEKALVWRLVHLDNVPWLLEHGLPCASAESLASSYTAIGNEELIAKRRTIEVSRSPGGTLADYVPFYFTPFSPMACNIRTGHHVPHVPNDRLAIGWRSSCPTLRRLRSFGLRCLFTDAHAAMATTRFYEDPDDLRQIDWSILQRRDFTLDRNVDPRKRERYQAEALVFRHVPTEAVRGIFVYREDVKASLDSMIARLGLTLPVSVGRRTWYFR